MLPHQSITQRNTIIIIIIIIINIIIIIIIIISSSFTTAHAGIFAAAKDAMMKLREDEEEGQPLPRVQVLADAHIIGWGTGGWGLGVGVWGLVKGWGFKFTVPLRAAIMVHDSIFALPPRKAGPAMNLMHAAVMSP